MSLLTPPKSDTAVLVRVAGIWLRERCFHDDRSLTITGVYYMWALQDGGAPATKSKEATAKKKKGAKAKK
jgi:hypothetical protein